MASLFSPGRSNSSAINIKAGKMTMSGKRVTADSRPGKLTVVNDDAGLVNVVWQNRTTSADDEPIMVFPGEATFHRCKSCTTGRVIYLKFTTGRRDFFWLQDKDASQDEANLTALNWALSGETMSRMVSVDDAALALREGAEYADDMEEMDEDGDGDATGFGGLAEHLDQDSLELLRALPAEDRLEFGRNLGLPPHVLAELLGEAAPTTPAATAPATTAPAAPAPAPAAAPAAVAADASAPLFDVMAAVAAVTQPPALGDVLSGESLEPLLARPDFVAALQPFLPAGQDTDAAALRSNLRSPQYSQALRLFDAALREGASDAVAAQLGLDPVAVGQGGGGIRGLLHALQQQADAEKK